MLQFQTIECRPAAARTWMLWPGGEESQLGSCCMGRTHQNMNGPLADKTGGMTD